MNMVKMENFRPYPFLTTCVPSDHYQIYLRKEAIRYLGSNCSTCTCEKKFKHEYEISYYIEDYLELKLFRQNKY